MRSNVKMEAHVSQTPSPPAATSVTVSLRSPALFVKIVSGMWLLVTLAFQIWKLWKTVFFKEMLGVSRPSLVPSAAPVFPTNTLVELNVSI